jgi:hypothetical protein
MKGEIKNFLRSQDAEDKKVISEVFGKNFRSDIAFYQFFSANLYNLSVADQLKAPKDSWSVKNFHALFIACWIHHPLEKGTYMIMLTDLSLEQRKNLKEAIEKKLSSRKSSHLSGSGYSATKDWDFLNGYEELLIQYEMDANSLPFLFLKAEGHNTGITSVVPHLKSWWHKRKTGEGLQASPALNALPQRLPGVVQNRAAENYETNYKKLLKAIGLHGPNVTVKEMFRKLCLDTGYPGGNPVNNAQLADAILKYCSAASTVGAGGIKFRANGKITGDMISGLKSFAATIKNDAPGLLNNERIFQEIRVTPAELDASLRNFRTY